MSGPKISDYELERRRQEQLRREYERKQRQIQEHLRQQNAFREGLKTNSQQVQRLLEDGLETFEKLRQDKRCCISADTIKHLAEQTRAAIKNSLEVHNKKEIARNEYDKCINDLEQYTRAWMKKSQEFANERMALESDTFLQEMIAVRKASASASKSQQKQSDKTDAETMLQASNEYNRCVALLTKALSELPEKEERLQKALRQLHFEMMETHGTPKENLRLMQRNYQELSYRVNSWKQEKEEKEASESKRKEWMRLYRFYCTELEQPLMSVEQLEAKSEAELESLCATLDNKLYSMYEENYIYQCIEEAMAEIGYQRYGQANNGVKGQFLYRMHGDTMVHVSCSDSGLISMEIGVASAGRQRQLDVREVNDLVQKDMPTFCRDYAEIQKNLAVKGVLFKNSVLLEPSAEYAHTLDCSQYTDHKDSKSEVTGETKYLYLEDN